VCPLLGNVRSGENRFQSNQQENRARVWYLNVDAEPADEVSSDEVVKGYKVDRQGFARVAHKPAGNVVDLMSALRASLKDEGGRKPAPNRPKAKAPKREES
jgi:non-homologous end joining protein Ku